MFPNVPECSRMFPNVLPTRTRTRPIPPGCLLRAGVVCALDVTGPAGGPAKPNRVILLPTRMTRS
eukprot:3259457-Pyramimonas_sp.AAC.1